ncbi:MAG: redoxin domain-containing protein [Proteobacteria bacterium]|nr:redoxin domain-containing protein [Pseudomonadota bacterium]
MKRHWTAIGAAAVLIALTVFFVACDQSSIFEIGDTVPDFTMPDQYNAEVKLSDLINEDGMNGAVLAFYILDNSPG